ncbi:MAG: ABC transporter ATP-binding protein [Candidatus Micrarchaeota archaeon]
MIEAKDVRKTFWLGKNEVRAVRGISMKVEKGDFIFIIGPSGSGKTTLMDMMGALSKPTSGKIFVDGRDVSQFNEFQLSILRRDKIGFIFQSFNLIPTLDVLDNVLITVLPQGEVEKYRGKAISILEMLGLGQRLHHRPNELSGGERQRVAVARALLNDPEVVLADEPTGELDSHTGSELMDYMRKMNKEKQTTFVIVTHDTSYIKPKDHVYTIRDGIIHTAEKDGKIQHPRKRK